ncbi:hypothetical protein [Roseibium sediminis]|uniref:hypothetical protein n=1 Tax=Roseibium sediminis TaxID=1775174 RepID=UPI00123CC5E7|nr:hypothetical protein [Roseibium sediminis]
MSMNYLPRDEYDRLSIASKDLVKKVGGEARALEITGYKQATQISRCTTIDGLDRRFFPIKAVAELEADVVESGAIPPVTAVLAAMAGFDLVRRERCKGDVCALSSLGLMMKAVGEATASVTDAYADGKLTAKEKADSLARLLALADQVSRTIAILRGEQVSPENEEDI